MTTHESLIGRAEPSFGYHPDVDRLDVALDRTSFSRALVLDYPVRGLVDRVPECRVLWQPDVALPEGIYWFEGIERPILLQVAVGATPGDSALAPLAGLGDSHPLMAAWGWAEELWTLALATPWLTTKTDDVLATGRFGIGLMTLRALSNVIDVHSGPYHVRIGEPIISWAAADVPVALSDPRATTLCLPVDETVLDTHDLVAWMAGWDESALLFLKSVKRVAVLTDGGSEIRTLSLAWSEDDSTIHSVSGHQLEVCRRHATAPDGRRWIVHSVEAPTPPDVQRARKKTGATVPIALALAMHPEDHGGIYAGLPVTKTSAPLRVNAQFDPVTSRTTLAPTLWNRAMLPLRQRRHRPTDERLSSAVGQFSACGHGQRRATK